MVPLQWLLGHNHMHSQPVRRLDPAEIQLAKALWTLVDCCLRSHFSEDGLAGFTSTRVELMMCATPSLQQPALQDFQPLTDCVSAALKHMAEDKALGTVDEWHVPPTVVRVLGHAKLEPIAVLFGHLWVFVGGFCIAPQYDRLSDIMSFRIPTRHWLLSNP